MHRFTVEEILNAAEKNKYKNFNDEYIQYDERGKVVAACVIGEAFLNLGLVENGRDARALSESLMAVHPDDGEITISYSYKNPYYGDDYFHHEPKRITEYQTYEDLSGFINSLNGRSGYRGKKRLVALARKYFSNSLKQVVKF